MLFNSDHYRIPEVTADAEIPEGVRLVVLTQNTTTEEVNLLQKMLSSTGLNASEYMHFNSENGYLPVKSIAEQASGCKILCFDLQPQEVGLQCTIKKYRPIHICGTEVIFVDDLSSIADELPLKKFIWNQFKSWFVHD